MSRSSCATSGGINGHRVATTDDEVVEPVVAVAAGEPNDVATIAERLRPWSPGPA